MSPIQSPVLEMTCASHSRKNDRVPNTRHGAGGTGASSAVARDERSRPLLSALT